MTSDSGGQEVLESIVAALPEMAHYIDSIPDGQKATALAALESHYLKTAINLGFRGACPCVGSCLLWLICGSDWT